jgi:hypothetical protein
MWSNYETFADKDLNLDVVKVGEAFTNRIGPLLERSELSRLDLAIDGNTAILHACIPAF